MEIETKLLVMALEISGSNRKEARQTTGIHREQITGDCA
jgi:hypothetical protein